MLLGGVFFYFLYAGTRTFHSDDWSAEPGATFARVAFVGGAVQVWFLSSRQPMRFVNAIAAACLLAACIALYEWARRTIRQRRFGLGWGEHVPEELCEQGPYRHVRHPIYLSYMLAYLAAAVALPHWMTAAAFVCGVALFEHASRNDERVIAASPLAEGYAAYRTRTGRFLPRLRLSRATPGR